MNAKNLLSFIEELLRRKHQPDVELVKNYNAAPLNGYKVKDLIRDYQRYGIRT